MSKNLNSIKQIEAKMDFLLERLDVEVPDELKTLDDSSTDPQKLS